MAMNKSEFIEAYKAKLGDEVTKKAATAQVDAFLETLTDALVSGEKVTFVGVATFGTRIQKGGLKKAPKADAAKEVPDKLVPKVKFGKTVKEKVAASGKQASL